MKHIKLFENWVSNLSESTSENGALQFSKLVAHQFNDAKIENLYLDSNKYPHLKYLNISVDEENSGNIMDCGWYDDEAIMKDLKVSPAAYVVRMSDVEAVHADWDLWIAFEDNRIIPFATISEGWHDSVVGEEFSAGAATIKIAMAIAEICNNPEWGIIAA